MIRFRLFRRWWRLYWTGELPSGQGGEAHKEARTIKVAFGMDETNDLRVVIHELLHAANWKASERWVDHTSTVMARVLTRLGWQRVEPQEWTPRVVDRNRR